MTEASAGRAAYGTLCSMQYAFIPEAFFTRQQLTAAAEQRRPNERKPDADVQCRFGRLTLRGSVIKHIRPYKLDYGLLMVHVSQECSWRGLLKLLAILPPQPTPPYPAARSAYIDGLRWLPRRRRPSQKHFVMQTALQQTYI